jgi:uncharacterized membrane protein
MKANRDRKTSLMEGKEPLRLLALSDGLFATVLTLLVLDLRIPEALAAEGGTVTAFIKSLGPHLFSYLLTFWVAGTFWLAHHRNFDHVDHYDRALLGYNLLFLLFVGLFPFSTATVSLGGFQSGDYPFYWAVYAANIILAGVMLELTWNYAVSHGLLTEDTTRRESRYITLRQSVTPAVFLLSIIVEYLLPQAFLGPCTLLVIPLALWAVDRYPGEADLHKPSQRLSGSELLWRAGTTLPWLLIIGLAVWATTL